MSEYLMKCLWKGVADVDQQQDAADHIEELEAKLAWQPIETAPKDGTPVILGFSNSCWHSIVGHKEGKHFGVLTQNLGFQVLQVNPTHWMPLPDGPAALKGQDDE